MAPRDGRALNPGLPDMPRAVRSSAEVQQEKIAKAQQTQQQEDQRHEGISQAAAISNRMGWRRFRRPEKSTVEEEPIVEGAIVDPCSDGPGSSDDYQPDQEKQPLESEDEVMDASDEEAPKPTKTRVKQGVSMAKRKRKAHPVEPNLKKKQKKTPVGGIRVDWTRGRVLTMESVHAPSRSRSASSGAMSFISHRRSVSSDADVDMAGPPGSDASAIGGIQSDVDDGDEHEYTVEVTKNAMLSTPIAGIVETNGTGLVAPSTRLQSAGKIKKTDIKLSDIPDDIRPSLSRLTLPLRCSTSASDACDNRLVLVIQKLAQDKVDSWRNKLGTAGVNHWKQEF
ncbi:hypothetical protein K438DRAFT_1991361 [Mycena galopus ATCC 62051]|nr:hypothetical protein K438DRAFT_1991361 [Mycena galopus ATCC 62051]